MSDISTRQTSLYAVRARLHSASSAATSNETHSFAGRRMGVGRTERQDRLDRGRAPKQFPGVRTAARHRAGSVPDTTTPQAQAIADRFCDLCDRLVTQKSLDPSPRVNALFTELVGLTATTDAETTRQVLLDPQVRRRIPVLRQTCAKGEGRLEKHWAQRILAAEDPEAELQSFPYLQNYRDLVNMEVQAMQIAGPLPDRLLFIGSGPMPLTSYFLAKDHGIAVDNLDIDGVACREGEQVMHALGQTSMGFAEGDVYSVDPAKLGSYDGIYVAALAGLDRGVKREVFEHLAAHAKDDSIAVARSAYRLRTLLYPEVEPEDAAGYKPVSLVHPLDDVVNSALIVRKEG